MRWLVLLLAVPLHAAVIGVSKPAESITAARMSSLPKHQQAAWLLYLKHSERQMKVDQDALFEERNRRSGPMPAMPKEGSSTRSIPLDRDAAFYKTDEAKRIAATILSFQIPNGGWSKNLDMTQAPRLPGQSYTANNLSRFPGVDDFDAPKNPNWNYVGTLDNDATNTELHYLARMASALPGQEGNGYRASFIRGVHYQLNAQFPNGGWPQVWPLEGGYHDAITFNDNAVTESAELLRDVAEGGGDYGFVGTDLRKLAGAAADRAVGCILRTQVRVGGKLTVWGQQHDALTLLPVAGRNFEPAALSAGESADLLIFLMKLPRPGEAVRAAVEAGVAWLKATEIRGYAWVGGRETPGGRHLEASAGGAAMWSRYTSLETGKPVFGDRDKTIHDDVAELTLERRNGYAWYSSGPQRALDAYTGWKKALR